MAVLVTLDVAFLNYAVSYTLRVGPSVLLLFGFEYVILATKVCATSASNLSPLSTTGWTGGGITRAHSCFISSS